MKLKLKFLKISAGRPVAFIHKDFSELSSIHADERVALSKGKNSIIAVVDIATGILNKNEIAVSTEIAESLIFKEGEEVMVKQASKAASLDFIKTKLSGKPLDSKQIYTIIKDIVENKINESEIAFFVSAVYNSGMSLKETEDTIQALVKTGKKFNFGKNIVDKHSIGGIPGRTTPIVVAICSSLGLFMPKTSSRAITTPAGTADCMETICKVDFSIQELKKILKKTNACIVWGGSLNLAPVDDRIIHIERQLNLDPESQLLASILSKKVSVGAKNVLIDIPYGKNAKVSFEKAQELEKKFKYLAKRFRMHLECALSEAREPLGHGIGPALEIKEVIKVLKRDSPCHLIEEKSLKLAGKLLEMTGKAKKGQGIKLAKENLDSGRAYKKFEEIVKAQRGKLSLIREARFSKTILAQKNSKITEINIKNLNQLARILGCPADKFAGIYLYKHLNENVKKGEKLLTLYADSLDELKEGINFFEHSTSIKLKYI